MSLEKPILKMIFLFPRWDMLIPQRVYLVLTSDANRWSAFWFSKIASCQDGFWVSPDRCRGIAGDGWARWGANATCWGAARKQDGEWPTGWPTLKRARIERQTRCFAEVAPFDSPRFFGTTLWICHRHGAVPTPLCEGMLGHHWRECLARISGIHKTYCHDTVHGRNPAPPGWDILHINFFKEFLPSTVSFSAPTYPSFGPPGNSFQRLRGWFNSMRSDQFGCVDITQVETPGWSCGSPKNHFKGWKNSGLVELKWLCDMYIYINMYTLYIYIYI